jgi:poly-gamma-glutamate synthesis protein (capsule biosynthesis protein)
VALTDWTADGILPRTDRPTIAAASVDGIRRLVTAARRAVDVVVVSVHWGAEFDPVPTDRQRELASAAVEAGADLVVGHHPHVLQPIEVTTKPTGRTALVAYSLGNFLFDQHTRGAEKSVILLCEFSSAGLQSASAVPAKTVDCRPVISGERRALWPHPPAG